jgi:hypothetical protein
MKVAPLPVSISVLPFLVTLFSVILHVTEGNTKIEEDLIKLILSSKSKFTSGVIVSSAVKFWVGTPLGTLSLFLKPALGVWYGIGTASGLILVISESGLIFIFKPEINSVGFFNPVTFLAAVQVQVPLTSLPLWDRDLAPAACTAIPTGDLSQGFPDLLKSGCWWNWHPERVVPSLISFRERPLG